jgi:hypothetical protein
MKRAQLLSVTVVVFATLGVSAVAQDRPDRGLRLDSDAIRNDIREDRLKIPEHPLSAGQTSQPVDQQPAAQTAPKTKPKPKSKSKPKAKQPPQ